MTPFSYTIYFVWVQSYKKTLIISISCSQIIEFLTCNSVLFNSISDVVIFQASLSCKYASCSLGNLLHSWLQFPSRSLHGIGHFNAHCLIGNVTFWFIGVKREIAKMYEHRQYVILAIDDWQVILKLRCVYSATCPVNINIMSSFSPSKLRFNTFVINQSLWHEIGTS